MLVGVVSCQEWKTLQALGKCFHINSCVEHQLREICVWVKFYLLFLVQFGSFRTWIGFFSCISQPTLVGLVWVCFLCSLLCSSSGYKPEPFGSIQKQMCVIRATKDFPVSADTGLGSGPCLRQGKWFFTQLALMISFRWLFLSGRESTHDKVPLFMGWSRGESLCGLESSWREKSCRELCCAFVFWEKSLTKERWMWRNINE